MNSTKDMAKAVTEWAEENENVRAVVLTSSRANPHAPVDLLSDYDIELYVGDLRPFLNDQWPETFGEVLVREPYTWELTEITVTENPDGSSRIEGNAGCMVIYRDAPRIDFTILLTEVLEEDIARHGGYVNDMGYEILLDKDGLTGNAVPPTYSEYWTRRPNESEYQEVVHHFWWDITYVAKYLHRGELFFAKYMLDGSLHHHYLRTVISWHIGMRSQWQSNPGAFGRWFEKQLDPDIWADIEATFAGADAEENWDAMFKMAEVFGRLASEAGVHLGYAYPIELDRNVKAYLSETRGLD
jgi:aminoglycoside 6-adenylyltransferase